MGSYGNINVFGVTVHGIDVKAVGIVLLIDHPNNGVEDRFC
jgi:hypothetical protein